MILIPFILGVFLVSCAEKKTEEKITILLLSGKNNHDWEKTTEVLLALYERFPVFGTHLTEQPDTLTYEYLMNYDAVVSNWNNWPDDRPQWPEELKNGFIRYVEEGGGAVFFHAGASSFYDWEAYHRIGIGRWGENTSHGKQTKGKVFDLDQDHPVTRGLSSFYIMDEIWENTDIHPEASVIGYVKATDETDGHPIEEPAVFVNRHGEGRSFYTILGHNERALFNTGLETLLVRGTEWAATGKVTLGVPQNLSQATFDNDSYRWTETDTSLSLMNNSGTVWQYNFRNKYEKPYFHPLYLNNARITCLSPPDHPWHPGLWFSWKFIDGKNYWEYRNEFRTEKTGFKSEGITGQSRIRLLTHEDFSADIILGINYHPEGGQPVLEEERSIHVSRPGGAAGYYIDYEHVFTPLKDSVVLDRTPILGEPDGKSWGGYGGLSIRFNQDFTSPVFIPAVDNREYPRNEWFYMGFNTLTGEKAGVAMFQHPGHTTPHTRWYYVNDPATPFYFFSPAALYDHRIVLKKGETLKLKYRVWLLPGEVSESLLNDKYRQFVEVGN